MNYKVPLHIKIQKITFNSLLVLLAVGLVAGIWLYNSTVTFANGVEDQEAMIAILESEIASEKNILYGIKDFQDLATIVENLKLIRELNPTYLNLGEVNQLTRR